MSKEVHVWINHRMSDQTPDVIMGPNERGLSIVVTEAGELLVRRSSDQNMGSSVTVAAFARGKWAGAQVKEK